MKKKRHPFAVLFMAAAVAVSVPLGINRSLSKMREEAGLHFYYDDTGYALYEGLEKRREEAANLITVANRYTSGNAELTKLADELDHQIKLCEKYEYEDEDNTFTKVVESNAALDPPAQALAQALEKVGLSEKDKKYPAQLIANMESEQDKLERSSFNEEAGKYNQKLEELKPLAVLKPMSTFSGEGSQTAGETPTETAGDAIGGRAEAFANDVQERAEGLVDDIVDSVLH